MSYVKLPPGGVKAVAVDDISDRQNSPPGAFKFFAAGGRVVGLNYRCPCGCGSLAPLDFKPAESPSWNWDGNREAPTLSPSVHHEGHWHGYLRGGIWVDA